jgi:hypothetical protein
MERRASTPVGGLAFSECRATGRKIAAVAIVVASTTLARGASACSPSHHDRSGAPQDERRTGVFDVGETRALRSQLANLYAALLLPDRQHRAFRQADDFFRD